MSPRSCSSHGFSGSSRSFSRERRTIVNGLRISFGSALVAVVPAEMLLGELGVGYLSWIEWNNLDIAGVIFAILVVGVVGVILDAGFNKLAGLVTYQE